MWYEWFFDGIGTAIISFVLGALIGSYTGYKVGIKKSGHQKQIASDYSNQEQQMVTEEDNIIVVGKNHENIRQVQKAGKNSEQKQFGTIK